MSENYFIRVRFSILYVGTADAKDIKIGEAGFGIKHGLI